MSPFEQPGAQSRPGRVHELPCGGAHRGSRRKAPTAVGCARCPGRCAHGTGARSVRPSQGRPYLKTFARDHGGHSARASPGRCSKTANRHRTSTGAAASGYVPDPAWCWHSVAAANPTRDLPPCQRAAPWCAVASRAARRASRGRGVGASSAPDLRVLRALRIREADPANVGRADVRRALEGARGFLETGVDAPAITGPGRRLPSWTAFLYTLTSLIGGGCQLPLGAQRGSREPLGHVDRGPPWTCSPVVYGCGKRRRPPERGLFGGGFLVPRVVIAMGSSMGGKSLDARRAHRRPTPDSRRCACDARKQRGTPDAPLEGEASARASPARLWRISLGWTAEEAGAGARRSLRRRRLGSHGRRHDVGRGSTTSSSRSTPTPRWSGESPGCPGCETFSRAPRSCLDFPFPGRYIP